ncbi:hypothetical protein MMC16_005681 [Acarospora aff. strigata]|nr:hypothetical protein [Acarospora aff. strigata]
MGDIYRFAHSVTVWLGTEDERIRPALGTLRDFPRAHEEHLRQVGHNIDTVYEAATITELPISPPQAKTLACFFARAWFSRAWILQEIVVARGVLVFSGRLRSSWSLLTNASTHISRNQLGRVIARIATPDSEALVLHAGIVPYSVASYRETTMNGSMSFEQSLILTRSSECTDPRDRCPEYEEEIIRELSTHFNNILRSLAAGTTPASLASVPGTILTDRLRHHQLPPPQYAKSVAQVYIEATQLAMLYSNSLSMLSHVGGSSERNTADLPSCVPDFTTAIAPRPMSHSHSANRSLAWDNVVDIGETSDEALRGEGRFGSISLTLALDSPYVTGEDRVEVLWTT